MVHLRRVRNCWKTPRDGERRLGAVEQMVALLQNLWNWSPVCRERVQQSQVRIHATSASLCWTYLSFMCCSLTDQSLEASTAPEKGSVIGPVTQNPARTINQPLERCCAVSLTQCLTTMSSTSGFLLLTHVSYTVKHHRSTSTSCSSTTD